MQEKRTPFILKDTSRGLEAYHIEDDMLVRREVECVGEIREENAYELCQQLRYLDRIDPEKEITLFINSPGGSVAGGLAVLDVIRTIKAKVHTVCLGTAASMGAVLLAVGDHRSIYPHSEVMIHDPLTPETSGSALHLQEKSRRLMDKRKVICEILAECCHKKLKQIYAKTAKDTWFSAKEALEFGLVDEIIWKD
ncbi:MAG: ATP-dependent Clp protease proteolytic subunit [Lachnospiraceae bacterium]|nr:ATP-dependent Clp protease proteolytic subunit [Lachnospiraceae bacterium]